MGEAFHLMLSNQEQHQFLNSIQVQAHAAWYVWQTMDIDKEQTALTDEELHRRLREADKAVDALLQHLMENYQ